MISAAERLVAERGLSAMSLREVQSLSGQRNKSAAQYHFGSREGLIEAVVRMRMGQVNERRAELLAAIDPARPSATSTEALAPLVDALVRPLVELSIHQRDSHWARFVLQCWMDPLLSVVVQASVEGAAYRELRDRLADSLTHVPAPRRDRRIDQAIGVVFLALAAAEATLADQEDLTPMARAARWHDERVDLTDVCVGILTAASPFP